MDFLRVSNISKRQGEDLLLYDVSFEQREGKKIAIAGETGSGKTTLLRIVAGLGQADSGEVFFQGKKVIGIEEKMMPGHKGIAFLSQHFELRNKYRVEELMNYANDLTEEESKKLYNVCRIAHLMKRWTSTLSGGERQRVALGSLLTEKPKLLLLDEPFSNLDQIHKQQLRKVLDDISEKLSISCILVSHDGEDILPWADEILVMREGKIIQRGSPEEIYKRAETEYTAGLFGKYNWLNGKLAEVLSVPDNTYLRPEDLCIAEKGTVKAIAGRCYYMGSCYELEVRVEGQVLIVETDKRYKPGEEIFLAVRQL
jgi:ABC-type sulfate/molybdate transport systems ATPase subunit